MNFRPQTLSPQLFLWRLLVGTCLCFLLAQTSQAQFWKKKHASLLPEEEAFQVTATVNAQGQLLVDWSIADDYYMYREQLAIESQTDNVTIGDIEFPTGVIEDDPEFGEVEVYFYNVGLKAPISGPANIDLLLKGQGCNKPVGVCYPPMQRLVTVTLPMENTLEQTGPQTDNTADNEEQDRSWWGYVLAAFGTGLLLSFTPCVLPMIPILAGVIAGQQAPSRWRAGWLSICYVAGTVVTYLIAGAIAGATGAQLQAWFQNIWVIGAICLVLIALACSLFGLYRIELPRAWQSRINQAGRGGSAAVSTFVLGLASALVVGACVSPLLIVALGAAISQGDPVLGAAIMGSMALGMGVLLILFGLGAGWLLPRTGPWMQHIQIVFGFMLLAVVIYLLASFPWVPVLLLWAALLLASGFYLWHVASEIRHLLISSLWRMLAAGLLIWGVLAGVGAALRGDDVLNPLVGISFRGDHPAGKSSLPLVTTHSLAEVETQLAIARSQNKPVMLDFYADWCLDCKRMHRTTFRDPTVVQALASWHLIEVDVTPNSADNIAVKKHFEVFGPPATLFFNHRGQEATTLRQYGYVNSAQFLALVQQVNWQSNETKP